MIPRDQWLDFVDDGPDYAPVQKVHCLLCHRLTDTWRGGWLNGRWRYLCAEHQPTPQPPTAPATKEKTNE